MVFPGGVGSWPVSYKCIRNEIFLCWNISDLSKSISRSSCILDSALMVGGSVQAGENLSVSVGILSRVSIRLTKKASRLSLEGAAVGLADTCS